MVVTQPPPVVPVYAKILVTDPLWLQSAARFLGGAPFWSYQIVAQLLPPGDVNPQVSTGHWQVRRRFRHVVALEDRLRQECPGAILPPRPDKHAARAIEEASTQQSAEFALLRTAELQVYLNQLITHPIVARSHTLRLFLSLQDDLGTAWPECSNNALTRLANASVGAAVKVSEQTSERLQEHGEDDAELLALQSAESVRMGAVMQAVPKLEGAVTLLREGAELSGGVGMEMSRLAKEVVNTDRELSQPIDLLSSGLLRSSRRSKRTALELSAALNAFTHQYKTCRYVRMALQDRRHAIQKRYKERSRADQRASQFYAQQRNAAYGQQPYGQQSHLYNGMDPMDAVRMDAMATDTVQECEEIGQRLKSEINRVAYDRRTTWNQSVKVMASAMKEGLSERVAIWESVQQSFLQAFPEYDPEQNQQGSLT
jgi:hypothetical protein